MQADAHSDRYIIRQKFIVGDEIALEKSISIGGKIQSINGLKNVVHIHNDP